MAPLPPLSSTQQLEKVKEGICGISQMTINPTTDICFIRPACRPEEERRQQIAIIETFKVVHNIFPPYIQDLIIPL